MGLVRGLNKTTLSPRSTPSIRPPLRVTTSCPTESPLNEPLTQESDNRSSASSPGARSRENERSRVTRSHLTPHAIQLRNSPRVSSAGSDRDRNTDEDSFTHRTGSVSSEGQVLLPYYTVAHQRKPVFWKRALQYVVARRKIFASAALTGSVIIICFEFGLFQYVSAIMKTIFDWCEENPILGPFIVIGMVGFLGAIYLPLHTACLISVGAAVRPLPLAILVNVVAANANAQAGYFAGKYALRDRVRKVAENFGGRKINVVRKAIESEGIKMVFMIRLILHLTVCNAVLTVTDVSYGQYSVGTLFGCIPGCAMLAYAGYIGRRSLLRDDAEPDEDGKLHFVFKILMVCVAVVVFAYVTMVAKRAVRLHGGEEEEDGSTLDEPLSSPYPTDATDLEVINVTPRSAESGKHGDRTRLWD